MPGLSVRHAAFAGSEIALISLRRGQMERLADRGKAGRALAELAEDPNEFLSTIQIGITLAGFLAWPQRRRPSPASSLRCLAFSAPQRDQWRSWP